MKEKVKIASSVASYDSAEKYTKQLKKNLLDLRTIAFKENSS